MRFVKNTVERLKQLADDKRFQPFFDRPMSVPKDDAAELIEALTDMLVVELDLDWKEADKVKYFLWLAHHVK